jgi:hypothetical protein
VVIRTVSGIAVAVALAVSGCGAGGQTPDTAAQVKRAFAAEGIPLIVSPYGTNPEDKLTAFDTANGDDELNVAVATDNATAKRTASQLAAMIGKPLADAYIVRSDNVVVVYGRTTSPKTRAAAERAIGRLRE